MQISMLRLFHLILVGFVLVGCSTSKEPTSTTQPAQTAAPNYKDLSNNELCQKGTFRGKWETQLPYSKYADEARRRGLHCNVSEINNKRAYRDNLDDILMLGLDRVKNLGLLSSDDVGSVKDSLLEMPNTEYKKTVRICSSAFDDLEPQKCDAVLRSLSN